jgi:hypothetical protein
MNRYFFGYLFVRLAKILAVIAMIGGLSGAVLRYFQGTLESASIRYKPSAILGSELFALGKDWDQMRDVITHFMGQSAPPMTAAHFSGAPTSASEFNQLMAQLTKLQGERDLVKSTVVKQFEASLTEIERKLRAHAASLADAPSPPKAAAPKAESDDTGITGAPVQKTLFDSLGRAEIAERRDLLKVSNEFISLLKAASENPQNAATLGRALDELANLEKLLPTNLETVSRKPPKSDPDIPVPLIPKVNAAKVADQLEQVRRSVRVAMLRDWSVDHALAQTITAVESENTRCIEASRSLQRLWLTVFTNIAIIIVCTAVTSFLILVLADLTQAFLDTASNTAVVALAYQNAAQPELAEEQ